MSSNELTANILATASPSERHIPGETGVWVFILGDMVVFALFFGVFSYYRGLTPDVFSASQATLNANYGLINTFLLLTSSWFVVMGMNAAKRHLQSAAAGLFGMAFLCGAGFSAIKVIEYSEKIGAGIYPVTNDFYMYYYILTGLHFVHVIIGMVVILFMVYRGWKGLSTGRDLAFLEGGASYWHMVDLLWIVLFPLIYLMK